MTSLGVLSDFFQAWIYLYFLHLKPADVVVANPFCVAYRFLSNNVPIRSLPTCLSYLADLSIKYQDSKDTFFMPFLDPSFSNVRPKWMSDLSYFENKPLTREEKIERSQQRASYLIPRLILIGGQVAISYQMLCSYGPYNPSQLTR